MAYARSATIYIYGLYEPDGHILKYVGRTDDPHERYKTHTRSFRRTKVSSWIKSRIDSGRYPRMVILEETNSNQCRDAEIWWIAFCKNMGVELLNMTSGGDGILNPDQETKNKMRLAKLGKPSARLG